MEAGHDTVGVMATGSVGRVKGLAQDYRWMAETMTVTSRWKSSSLGPSPTKRDTRV